MLRKIVRQCNTLTPATNTKIYSTWVQTLEYTRSRNANIATNKTILQLNLTKIHTIQNAMILKIPIKVFILHA